MTKLVARLVAMIGGLMILMRRRSGVVTTPAIGTAPQIPKAKPQGIPTLKMPTARGWAPGHVPTAAPGLKVAVDNGVFTQWAEFEVDRTLLQGRSVKAGD